MIRKQASAAAACESRVRYCLSCRGAGSPPRTFAYREHYTIFHS
jgi:hypothetical protein